MGILYSEVRDHFLHSNWSYWRCEYSLGLVSSLHSLPYTCLSRSGSSFHLEMLYFGYYKLTEVLFVGVKQMQ